MRKVTFIIFIFLALFFPFSVFAQAATLSLAPSSGAFNRNCNFTLDIRLDTGGAQTYGTDAILTYDSSRFTATSISTGNIYVDYAGNSIDDSLGRIVVSGLASVSSPFAGQGSLATINFTVKENAPTGATQIKFDFDPSDKQKTSDSNVAERGKTTDILSSVVNGNYTVGTGVCGKGGPGDGPGGPTATPSGQLPTQPPVKVLPPAGTEQLTFTLAIVGLVLVALGIMGIALL